MHDREIINGAEWIEMYDIRFFDHEDDWGWTILGTPPSRRILAAINRLAREHGVQLELSEAIEDSIDNFVFARKQAENVRFCDEDPSQYTWDWTTEFTDHGVPMTVVTLR